MPTPSAATLSIGAHVKHPARGVGTVASIIYSPLSKAPIKAWCEFPFIGTTTRKSLCFVEDLTLLPKPGAPGERPALSVVEPPPVVA